jgi:hypothetical protein
MHLVLHAGGCNNLENQGMDYLFMPHVLLQVDISSIHLIKVAPFICLDGSDPILSRRRGLY